MSDDDPCYDDEGDFEDDDPVCYECGGATERAGYKCSECQKDDCMGCGMCEDCIQLSIDAAEEWEPRPRQNCEACGRGLIDEDLEFGVGGMCIPCSEE